MVLRLDRLTPVNVVWAVSKRTADEAGIGQRGTEGGAEGGGSAAVAQQPPPEIWHKSTRHVCVVEKKHEMLLQRAVTAIRRKYSTIIRNVVLLPLRVIFLAF